ncbi:MAG: FAD-dependent oxidoreductase [Verrucomicrobiia bacterium]
MIADNIMLRVLKIICLLHIVLLTASAQIKFETDICIYGATSGGTVAAIQAARMGKEVVLLAYRDHIGGMTSGGLGWTDYGNQNAIGGIAREFYQRVGQYYGTPIRWTFEPKVAESVFKTMLNESKVRVIYRQRLASVIKDGKKITEIVTEDGNRFRAKMFIDATYEGDLMAMAGVSFTLGREGTNVYGENLNGIRPTTPQHQFVVNVDPYRTPGDTNSGLLPYIQPGDGGTPGDGDHRIQAYNFRLCLTKVETNKIALTPPLNYNPYNYELLARYIQARINVGHSLSLSSFLKIDSIPNGKTDINNNGAFSTDFIGMNYTYPTNNWIERERMWNEHRDYILGLLWFLATDERVPANVRTEMQSYGFCRDEFIDTGGFPHQLYVREARRMVSDYVMTQANCQGNRIANDSVGLGSYTMDSHNCQRIVQNGVVKNEGDVQSPVPQPYPISYRSIIPRSNECENLFVTFALSASHIAFGSIRMEPVFMILSQSAATAAAFAIDDNLAIQQVNYEKLKLQLLADKQLLFWGSDPSMDTGIILDNNDTNGVFIVGDWIASTSKPGYWGLNYIHDGNTNKGQKSVRFVPIIPSNSIYEVYLRWTDDQNRADNVPVDIIHSSGTNRVLINQKTNGGKWNLIGAFPMRAGTNSSAVIRTDSTTGYVVVDAVKFSPSGSIDLPIIQIIPTKPLAKEWGTAPAILTLTRSGNTNQELSVYYTVSGIASNGIDYSQLSGVVNFPVNSAFAAILIEPLEDLLSEGDESVVITLLPNTNYIIGNFSNATVWIIDKPISNWKYRSFSASQLQDSRISGDFADPDNDGIVNVKEYVLGLNPLSPETNFVGAKAEWKNGEFIITLEIVKGVSDYTILFESSEDLIHWTSETNKLEVSVENETFTTYTLKARYKGILSKQAFIRWSPVAY